MKLHCDKHPTFNGMTDIAPKCLDCAAIYVVMHRFQTENEETETYENNLKAEKALVEPKA